MGFDCSGPEASTSQQIARGVLAGFLVLLGLWTLHDFLTALVWAAILAISIWPLYRRAQRRWPPGRHNILIPSLFTLLVTLVFVVPLVLAAVQIASDAHGSIAWLVDARNNGIPVPAIVGQLPIGQRQVTAWWQHNLADPHGAQALLGRSTHDAMSLGREMGALVAHRFVVFGFTLLTLFFLFKEGPAVSAQMLVASRRAFGPRGERLGRQVIASVHGTVDGLVLVGLGEGVVLGIAYAVAGVPHPTLLGGATAIAAMVPFGAALVFCAAALLLLVQGSTVAAVVVVVLGLVVTFAADHFIRPALIGGATRLPFLWVLLGILGGVETWGLIGLFLGPAIMSALIMLWREWTTEEAA
ncbi:MAG: AI-2E family transporter [Janthinobacterium lividum]